MTDQDPFDLERFVDAQDAGDNYEHALRELGQGRKETHWMWFVFPQLRDLGQSPTAQRFGISTMEEADAYLRHPILGTRLLECTDLVAQIEGRSARDIFGSMDEMKLRSSMTLFSRADPNEPLFLAVLERYFDGAPDKATELLLAA
jgi:uncharacterized protein (DUF1810 family)